VERARLIRGTCARDPEGVPFSCVARKTDRRPATTPGGLGRRGERSSMSPRSTKRSATPDGTGGGSCSRRTFEDDQLEVLAMVEVQGLPGRDRRPIQLCYREDRNLSDAAQKLRFGRSRACRRYTLVLTSIRKVLEKRAYPKVVRLVMPTTALIPRATKRTGTLVIVAKGRLTSLRRSLRPGGMRGRETCGATSRRRRHRRTAARAR